VLFGSTDQGLGLRSLTKAVPGVVGPFRPGALADFCDAMSIVIVGPCRDP
jgi:hypothetical protein